MERLYNDYLAPTPEANELYSTFKFTPLEGLDYHNGDGTISRRDPSKVIRVNGKYYVWYTHRQTRHAAARRRAGHRHDPVHRLGPGRDLVCHQRRRLQVAGARRGDPASAQTASRLALGQHGRHPRLEGEVLPLLPGLPRNVRQARRRLSRDRFGGGFAGRSVAALPTRSSSPTARPANGTNTPSTIPIRSSTRERSISTTNPISTTPSPTSARMGWPRPTIRSARSPSIR